MIAFRAARHLSMSDFGFAFHINLCKFSDTLRLTIQNCLKPAFRRFDNGFISSLKNIPDNNCDKKASGIFLSMKICRKLSHASHPIATYKRSMKVLLFLNLDRRGKEKQKNFLSLIRGQKQKAKF
jgi:hypothetical protein